ncbi:MAG TPA: cytochrome c [Gemmatimonadaceae bacterium]|nr:cytochrome c [Gemmatimonadaceae bacterium]
MRIPRRVPLHPIVALALALVAVGSWSQSLSAQNEQGRAATKVEYEGWRRYMTTCARCHGDDAVGGVMAPDLRKTVASDSASQKSFHATVAEGRPAKGMPSFKSSLDAEQIDAIYAYLRARASNELPAGRPRQQ